eukprot:scaffold156177_cov31-Tisochrysis_lutea.AAC.8
MASRRVLDGAPRCPRAVCRQLSEGSVDRPAAPDTSRREPQPCLRRVVEPKKRAGGHGAPEARGVGCAEPVELLVLRLARGMHAICIQRRAGRWKSRRRVCHASEGRRLHTGRRRG